MAESACTSVGETKRLGAAMLRRYLTTLSGRRYCLSGSTLFISGLCQRSGMPGANTRIEMYAGY
ncbi:MAG TPA: hypothetical protein VHE82_00045 [Gemmatimonadaceae bacterium]|nr:hypothetical protein [Gemmatimonadaceae bacterium]